MQFHLFQYPIPNDADLSDLNRFVAANRIVSVHRDIVSTNGGPVLLFTVETAAGNVPDDTRAKRVDYREILSTDEFALFDRLRDVRKALAEAESVPLFGIFNNAQLAEMVTAKVQSIDAISAIKGVGEVRGKKYGDAMLKVLNTQK